MGIDELLRAHEQAILDEVSPAVARLEHYRRDGERATRQRLEALYDRVMGAVCTRDPGELLAHAARVARERFEDGYELSEVQAAVAVLEEAIGRALSGLAPGEDTWEVGLVDAAFTHGKDAIATTFASLGRRSCFSSIDLSALRASAGEELADELVFPV